MSKPNLDTMDESFRTPQAASTPSSLEEPMATCGNDLDSLDDVDDEAVFQQVGIASKLSDDIISKGKNIDKFLTS